jgi:thiamine-phosphate pyrophosphorylase
MHYPTTPGAARALERAQLFARHRGAVCLEPLDLLHALAADPDSRAAALLFESQIDPASLLPSDQPPLEDPHLAAPALPLSSSLRHILAEAAEAVRAFDRSRDIGTEHLLVALAASSDPVAARLEAAGLPAHDLIDRHARSSAEESEPLALSPEIPPLELATPGEASDLARILDASANRAREGLRVVEDYVRFALDDPSLTRRIKDCRHRLGLATRALEADGRLIPARDTSEDVGTLIMTPTERARENPRAVVAANLKRAAEALRSLEEYTKLVDPWLAGRFEVLRYDTYTLEKLVLTALASHASLRDARLYLLVGGLTNLNELTWLVGEALAGGVQVVQLREKNLPDRELLARAREVRSLTSQARARFILNDRADLAILAGADGVHLGQEDLAVRDARRILGPSAMIGVSTHDLSQLEQATLAGAAYLGVGPVFSTGTKTFDSLAGLAFVEQAAAATTLPWFAIGGITPENIDEVLNAGARRVAVHSAIVRAPKPRETAATLRGRLDRASMPEEHE